MKILIIANIRSQQGGITTQVLELNESLLKEGYETKIVSTHGSHTERFSSLFKAIKESFNCSVILGVGCAYYGIIPMLVSSLVSLISGKPVIYNFHDGQVEEFLKKYSGLLKLFFGRDKIIVATSFLGRSFGKYGFNSEIINNHLNEVGLKVNSSSVSGKKVIWARSFEELYRPDIALEAAKRTVNVCNAEFHFYGGGSLRDYYRSLYGSIRGIYFHDFVKREVLLEEYGKYDIFLNTSDYDNFPMSIVEAGMNGLQVLTSNAGGIASIYTGDEVTFFFKGNLDDCTERLNALLSDPGFYEYKKINLQEKIKGFTWESVRDNWISVFEGAVSKTQSMN